MSGPVAVPKKRLDELEAKERAHDDYLAGLTTLKTRAASIDLEVRGIREADLTAHLDYDHRPAIYAYSAGYRQALNDISLAIVFASQARHEHELVRTPVSDGSPAGQ